PRRGRRIWSGSIWRSQLSIRVVNDLPLVGDTTHEEALRALLAVDPDAPPILTRRRSNRPGEPRSRRL
ncbi:MAG: hypothetical protein ABSH36_03630, partial [Solirubrobacteraceae bacterium]